MTILAKKICGGIIVGPWEGPTMKSLYRPVPLPLSLPVPLPLLAQRFNRITLRDGFLGITAVLLDFV